MVVMQGVVISCVATETQATGGGTDEKTGRRWRERTSNGVEGRVSTVARFWPLPMDEQFGLRFALIEVDK